DRRGGTLDRRTGQGGIRTFGKGSALPTHRGQDHPGQLPTGTVRGTQGFCQGLHQVPNGPIRTFGPQGRGTRQHCGPGAGQPGRGQETVRTVDEPETPGSVQGEGQPQGKGDVLRRFYQGGLQLGPCQKKNKYL